MIWEKIVPHAWRTGLDILATGDCLHEEWRDYTEQRMIEDDSGLLVLRPEFEEACSHGLPGRLQRRLRFILSTEVSCVPSGTPYEHGLHQLIYFRSFDSARRFRSTLSRLGNLKRGRPALRLTPRQLLELVLTHGDGSAMAPAHILGPNFSTLGGKGGGKTLDGIFGDLTSHLLGVEVGITSTPTMCRRISSLDQHALFCSSDAHSLEKIGREYTLIETELNYDALMRRVRSPSAKRRFVKYPTECSGGYWNGCDDCRMVSTTPTCPRCGKPVTIGSRDRTEAIADRAPEDALPASPAFQQIMPLHTILASLMRVRSITQEVRRIRRHLLRELGHERHILTEASEAEIADASTPSLARVICHLRQNPPRYTPGKSTPAKIEFTPEWEFE